MPTSAIVRATAHVESVFGGHGTEGESDADKRLVAVVRRPVFVLAK